MALLVIVLNRRYLASPQHFHDSLDVFVHHDASPTFCITDDGEITYANKAARKRFGAIEQKSLVLLLGEHAANPVNVIFRLQSKARRERAASEDIVTDNGHLRVSTHYLGAQGFVWRLEDLVERPDDGEDVAELIGLPMLLANDEGMILYMNRALFVKTGCRITHIGRLFSDLPLRPYGLHQITTQNGPEAVRVVEHLRENGRRELFLVPCDPNEIAGATTRRLFDELPVALMKLSAEGLVLQANKLARGLVGETTDNDTPLSSLVQGMGRPISDWLRSATEGHALNRPEVVQATEKGTDVFLQVALNRVVEDGETYLIAVLNDATELKSLEAQFVQSQKMQAIGQLAGGVAHDFNNLLTAISGYCDLLLLRHDEGDPDYGDLIQINQNSNRAASLVSQLLAFSRKQNLQPETIDLRDALSDLSHLLNRLLGEKVNLCVRNSDDLKPVRADKRQLEQVLMNLVVNARDAMIDGGEVIITMENLLLEQEMHRDRALIESGKYVSIKVTDNGTGIAPDKLNKIFEPFFTTKKAGDGTGLGLSMAYGIIKQSGGYIFVDSALGHGCEFQILLPAYEKTDIAEAVKVPKPVRPRPGREEGAILLVEDEAPVRAFAARALRMRGYTVVEAKDAEQALEILEDEQLELDMFVTDVIMPGKDGPTWVREALIKRPETKVVFMSGYAKESFADQQAGIANSVFLPKPFSLNDLTETVQEQLADIY